MVYFKKKIEKSHERPRQLMLFERFKRWLLPDIKSFVDEKEDFFDTAARLANDKSLKRNTSFSYKSSSTKP